MSSYTPTARGNSLAYRLVRFVSRYFLLSVVGVVLLGALIVALSGTYPHRTPETLLVRDLLSYRPLLISISLFLSIGALLLPWFIERSECGGTEVKPDYRHFFVPYLCFGLGYANLLFGVVDSYLGILTPFLVGIIIDTRWRRRRTSLLKTLRTRAVYPFAVCIALYTLYTGLVVMGWSTDQTLAFSYWRKEVWLLVIPLCFLIYGGPSERLVQNFWQGALRIAWIYLVTFLVFHIGVFISCGANPLISFTFDKNYLQEAGFIISGASMLMPFCYTHYTYLGIYLLIPVVMTICSSHRSLRQTARWVLFGIMLYAWVLQARYVLLMTVAIGGYAIIYGIIEKLKHQKLKRDIAAYLMLAGSILLTLVYTTSPNLTQGYLSGGVRNDILRMSYDALHDIPIVIGAGLDYVYTLLLPLPINTVEDPFIIHFHNQYMQSLVQSGIIGLLLWLSILGSMLWIARRQRNSALIVVTSLWIILCNVDLVSYLSNYLIGMLFVICFALCTKGEERLDLRP